MNVVDDAPRRRLALNDDALVVNPGRRAEHRWLLKDVASVLPEYHPDLETHIGGLSFVEAPFARVILRSGRTLRIRVPDISEATRLARAWREVAPAEARAYDAELVRRATAARAPDAAKLGRDARRFNTLARVGAGSLVLGLAFTVAGGRFLASPVVRDVGRGLAAIGIVVAIGASLAGVAARWREMRRLAWARTRALWLKLDA